MYQNVIDNDISYGDIIDMLQRIIELAMQRINTTTADDIEGIQVEITAVNTEIKNEVEAIKAIDFSTLKSEGFSLDDNIEPLKYEELGTNNIPFYANVETIENANKTMEEMTEVINKIYEIRNKNGTVQNIVENARVYYNEIKSILENNTMGEEVKKVKLALVGLKNSDNIIKRANELTNDLCNDSYLSDMDKSRSITEIEQCISEIDRMAIYTKDEKGASLLNGQWDSKVNSTCENLGITGVKELLTTNAGQAASKMQGAIEKIASQIEYLEKIDQNTNTTNGLSEYWESRLENENGEYVFKGTDKKEMQWAQDLGIKIKQ